MEKRKLNVHPAAFNNQDPLYIGYVGDKKEARMTNQIPDLAIVQTKCSECEVIGESYTLKSFLEDSATPIKMMIERDGYVTIQCEQCLEAYKQGLQ